MQASASRRQRIRRGGVALAISLVAITLSASLLATTNASAATASMIVRGYVYDDTLSGVVGADVTATIKDGETIRTSYDTVSGSGGYYAVSFGPAEYDYGCTIEVYATDGVFENTNTSVAAEDAPFNWVNVTLATEIPEFAGAFGLSTAFAVAGIMAMVVLFGRRRR